MVSLQIQDEQLAVQLQRIAEKENRSVDAVLKTLLEQYEPDDASQRVRRKVYVKARAYWQSVGDTAKADLTDDELDEQFAFFDPEGIPRLKSEVDSLDPPVGTTAYAAKIIRELGGVRTSGDVDVTRMDEILNATFADDLLRRMSEDDADQ